MNNVKRDYKAQHADEIRSALLPARSVQQQQVILRL
jgi:hypothetical protein